MSSLLNCANAPATASLFIQLSMRRQAAAATALPVLDVLVPSRRAATTRPVRAYHLHATTTTTTIKPSRSAATTISASAAGRRISKPMTTSHKITPQQQPFSTSATRRSATATTSSSESQTQTIFNPQIDEDGKEMRLEITPRAAKRLTDIMKKDSNPYLALRIQVESGGCHGFQYLMSLVTLPDTFPQTPGKSEGELREDDTIFAYAADGASSSSSPEDLYTNPKIILDLPSLELLKGSKVDFTMELIGSQFKIVDNPLATSSCGCGTSFDIKF